jgi:hypothetical protein
MSGKSNVEAEGFEKKKVRLCQPVRRDATMQTSSTYDPSRLKRYGFVILALVDLKLSLSFPNEWIRVQIVPIMGRVQLLAMDREPMENLLAEHSGQKTSRHRSKFVSCSAAGSTAKEDLEQHLRLGQGLEWLLTKYHFP